MKTVKAILVTDKGRQSALLSADYASSAGSAVLSVEGVAYASEDLPAGAYLIVRSSEMADQAAMAGFLVGPPNSVVRRFYRIVGRYVMGGGLLAGAVVALGWAVHYALVLDPLAVLEWVGMSLFVGILGIVWWFVGDQIMFDDLARHRRDSRSFWRWFGSCRRRR